MTNYPTMPAVPPTPPEPPKPSRHGKLVSAVGLSVVIALGVGIFAGTWIDSDATDGASGTSASPTTVDPVEQPDFVPEQDEDSATVYVTPVKGDFSVDLKVKEKQCFGSAGCSLTVKPELAYDGPSAELDPDRTYEVTYEISGDESGVIVKTVELSDQDVVSYEETMVSTSSSSVKPKATVTGVEER